MSQNTVTAKFVSKKVSRVRIQPVAANVVGDAENFVTGSWDDLNNELALWQFPADVLEPVLLDRVDFEGDCLDLQFVDSSLLVSASSSGSVRLHKVQTNNLRELHAWRALHCYKKRSYPCTGIACIGTTIATAGEDGSIHILSTLHPEPTLTIADADSCSLTSVCFVSQNELLTGNFRGLMKLWDLRRTSNKPVSTMALAEDRDEGATSCARHPSQGHIVAIGGAEGTLFVYDLRRPKIPISVFTGPDGAINELKFHPNRPEHLFSCSEDGAVWQWKSVLTWFEEKVDTKEVLPQLPLAANSIDVVGERLVLGADNEAFYYFSSYEH